jgi:hypothetical protein
MEVDHHAEGAFIGKVEKLLLGLDQGGIEFHHLTLKFLKIRMIGVDAPRTQVFKNLTM